MVVFELKPRRWRENEYPRKADMPVGLRLVHSTAWEQAQVQGANRILPLLQYWKRETWSWYCKVFAMMDTEKLVCWHIVGLTLRLFLLVCELNWQNACPSWATNLFECLQCLQRWQLLLLGMRPSHMRDGDVTQLIGEWRSQGLGRRQLCPSSTSTFVVQICPEKMRLHWSRLGCTVMSWRVILLFLASRSRMGKCPSIVRLLVVYFLIHSTNNRRTTPLELACEADANMIVIHQVMCMWYYTVSKTWYWMASTVRSPQ